MYVDIINEQDNLILKQKNTSIWGSINKTRKFFMSVCTSILCSTGIGFNSNMLRMCDA